MSESPPPSTNPRLDGLQRGGRGPAPKADGSRPVSVELGEFETTREADYLERLAADRDLIRFMQLSGFADTTEEWRQFAMALAEYGYGVFRAWFGTGEIVRRLAARDVRGRSDLPAPFRLTEDEVQELSAELIIRGIRSFRENVLVRGRWRADGGATLKTFFVGHLLFMVPTTFRQWRRDGGSESLFDPNAPPKIPVPGVSASDRADLRLLLATVRSQLTAEVALLFELQAEGWSLAQIARRTGKSESNVKTLMMRARQRLARLYPEANQWVS